MHTTSSKQQAAGSTQHQPSWRPSCSSWSCWSTASLPLSPLCPPCPMGWPPCLALPCTNGAKAFSCSPPPRLLSCPTCWLALQGARPSYSACPRWACPHPPGLLRLQLWSSPALDWQSCDALRSQGCSPRRCRQRAASGGWTPCASHGGQCVVEAPTCFACFGPRHVRHVLSATGRCRPGQGRWGRLVLAPERRHASRDPCSLNKKSNRIACRARALFLLSATCTCF